MQVTASVDQEAVVTAVRQLGWRVYVNQPPDQLPLQEAVLAYRSEYLVERAMGRMKGWSLSLTAMYLERDDHVTGLIRLLSLGLRVLTRLEFGVRQRLATAKTTLAGLYVGSPTRATAHLTAEHLLEAFQGLMLAIIREGRRRRRHLTPLARLHQGSSGSWTSRRTFTRASVPILANRPENERTMRRELPINMLNREEESEYRDSLGLGIML